MRFKEPLQFCTFSVNVHLYITIHNKVIHVQHFKTKSPRKIVENYFFLAFILVMN